MRMSRLLVPVVALLALAIFPAVSGARDVRKVFVQDRCDPDTFNAVIGPGTCIRTGGVPFENFLRRVNPKDGGHNAWRFSRHDTTLKPGGSLDVTNTGGETHTFTEVANFGTGIVDLLNAALPPGTPPATPVGALNFIPAGGHLTLGSFSTGTHLFECLIHPWMRMTLEQR